MKIVGIEIHTDSIDKYLAGLEPISEGVLEVFVELLFGRFQGLLPNIRPTTNFRSTGGTGNQGIVSGVIALTFSDECLSAALAAAKFYRDGDRFIGHGELPLDIRVGDRAELY